MIQFYKPTLKRADMYTVLETMVSEHIGPGVREAEFTRFFASYNKCKEALSFRTYTDCIESALRVLGVKSDSVVAVSALSPYVYYLVLQKIGCKVVFVDVDAENGMPDSESVFSSGAGFLILYDTSTSLPVKYNRESTFYEKTDYGNVKILEDITESIGSFIDAEELYSGAFGSVVVCALEEYAVISAAGGAVMAVKGGATEESERFKKLREETADFSVFTKITDLNASLGLMQLQNMEMDNQKRRSVLSVYTTSFKASLCKRFGIASTEYTANGFSFSVFMNSKPDDFILFAKKKGVPLVKTFDNSIISHLDMSYYDKLPKTASFYSRTVSFPIYPFLKNADADMISKIIGALT